LEPTVSEQDLVAIIELPAPVPASKVSRPAAARRPAEVSQRHAAVYKRERLIVALGVLNGMLLGALSVVILWLMN
jgi:hypothetical protein